MEESGSLFGLDRSAIFISSDYWAKSESMGRGNKNARVGRFTLFLHLAADKGRDFEVFFLHDVT